VVSPINAPIKVLPHLPPCGQRGEIGGIFGQIRSIIPPLSGEIVGLNPRPPLFEVLSKPPHLAGAKILPTWGS